MERRAFFRTLRRVISWALLASGRPTMAVARGEDWLSVMIQREDVRSTSLRSVGYHRALRVMEIEFRSGSLYRYRHVPVSAYEALIQAKSKGRHFSEQMRGHYEVRRMDGPSP